MDSVDNVQPSTSRVDEEMAALNLTPAATREDFPSLEQILTFDGFFSTHSGSREVSYTCLSCFECGGRHCFWSSVVTNKCEGKPAQYSGISLYGSN